MSSLFIAEKTAVLLLAHGTPESVDDVPEFLRYVTGGRPLPPQLIEEIKHRYSLIGRSPLNDITMQQAKALECEVGLQVYVGMRNWKPLIPDVVKGMAADGIARAIAICMAPQNSRTSVGLYRHAVVGDNGAPFALEFVESWHDHPLLMEAFADKLCAGYKLACRELQAKPPVIFTAHSVPQQTIAGGDSYDKQACETAALVAASAGIAAEDWSFAFQSQGVSGGPWIGPRVEDAIMCLKEKGHRGVFIQPVGFLCDHVEVLYDIDIAFQDFAMKQGMRLWRSESLNDSPKLIAALADLVRSRLEHGTEP
jgi:ferrochelatase